MILHDGQQRARYMTVRSRSICSPSSVLSVKLSSGDCALALLTLQIHMDAPNQVWFVCGGGKSGGGAGGKTPWDQSQSMISGVRLRAWF